MSYLIGLIMMILLSTIWKFRMSMKTLLMTTLLDTNLTIMLLIPFVSAAKDLANPKLYSCLADT